MIDAAGPQDAEHAPDLAEAARTSFFGRYSPPAEFNSLASSAVSFNPRSDRPHLILVGFGNLGMKMFPTLLQLDADLRGRGLAGLEISIVDRKRPEESLIEDTLRKRFDEYSSLTFDPAKDFPFLYKNFFELELPPPGCPIDKLRLPEGLRGGFVRTRRSCT